MKTGMLNLVQVAALIAAVAVAACSEDDNNDTAAAAGAGGAATGAGAGGTSTAGGAGGTDAAAGASGAAAGGGGSTGATGDAQTPPTGAAADIDAWIAKGDYKSWKCEPEVHDSRSPSPHGKNRICSNDLLSAAGEGEYPVGTASVKELYNETGTEIVGYAVYRKLTAGGGESFYWYEVSSLLGGVVANGTGDQGTAKSICVGCHSAAGADANHSGHDFVYTQVK